MGRKSTTLKINAEKLRAAVGSHETWSAYAEKFGVTKQAVSNWLSTGKIPPRALFEIVRDLDIPKDILDEILISAEEASWPSRQIVIRISIEEKP